MSAEEKDNELEKRSKRSKKIRWIIIALIVFILIGASAFASYRTYYSQPEPKLPKEKQLTSAEQPKENIGQPANTDTEKKTTTDSKKTETPAAPTATTPAPAVEPTFLDFYIDLANTTIHGDPDITYRWTKNTVYAAGRPGIILPEYNTCLNTFVSGFNANSGNIRIINDTNQPSMDIQIEMVTMEWLRQTGGNYLPFATPHQTGGNITKVEIYLPTDSDWGYEEKCWSLKHEMMHAVGFHGHSNKKSNSEMSFAPIYMTSNPLSDTDQRAIRMLYQSGVPINSNQQSARDYFAGRSY